MIKKEWSNDALEIVASKFLDDIEISEQIRCQTVNSFTIFHQDVIELAKRSYEELNRRVYVTPTSFLELIKTFKSLLDKKRFEALNLKERYKLGLERLEAAKETLTSMKNELTELHPKMIKTSEETEELINIIEKEAGEVDVIKQIVEADTVSLSFGKEIFWLI